ncbi:MAG: hypothetical protein GEU99_10695 [Luteitalea sp.]|nr:hypothetical protein [Luteitalea sp.]
MSKKDEALRAFYEEMSESILQADDAELEEEYREGGMSMDADADRMRQLLANTFKTFQQRALVAARKKHEERTATISAQQFQLPASPEERRALLDAVIAQHQQAGRMLIAQHREFKELTDEDVESWLQQFGALGLLDKKPGSEK